MKTIQLVDKKGNILEVVDKPGFVVPDGFALKTRMVLMDSLKDQIKGTVTITDGSNDPYCLNRPGYRLLSDGGAARQEVGKAYAESIRTLSDAWRHDVEAATGPQEGAACTINDAPGVWNNGKCVPKEQNLRSREEMLANGDSIRRDAYRQSVADAADAWRR